MKGVNVVLKGRKNDNYGYLKITIRKSNKTKVYSLGQKVLKNDFNKSTQRLRKSAKNHEFINNLIETELIRHTTLPLSNSDIKTILSFIKLVINRTLNNGTKLKYQNIFNLFQNFLKTEYNKEDLFFYEVDSIVISDFYLWLRKRNSNNTANYKMKSFKSFFSKLKKEGIYQYVNDPFSSLEIKFDDTKKTYLSIDEFKHFITFNHREYRKNRTQSPIKLHLNDIKDSFIFSTICQGLRISDIMTLRFNDFVIKEVNTLQVEEYSLFLSKKMIKTKKIVDVYINEYSSQLIERQIIRIIETYALEIKNNDIYKVFIDCIKYRKELDNKLNEYKGRQFVAGTQELHDEFQKKIDETRSTMVENNHLCFFNFVFLLKLLRNHENAQTKFVFPFLDNELFKSINGNNDFSFMTDKQYLQFQGKRSYINKLLKELMKKASIKKGISFHSGRHTYTTLVLENDNNSINLFELQKTLGHTSIISTINYIRHFNTNKLKSFNNSITEQL